MSNRRKTIRVTGSFLLALFRANAHHTFDIFDNGLPADVGLVAVIIPVEEYRRLVLKADEAAPDPSMLHRVKTGDPITAATINSIREKVERHARPAPGAMPFKVEPGEYDPEYEPPPDSPEDL